MSDPSGPPEGVPERRKYQRVRLYMPGQLFNPVDEQTTDCKVLDLSAGGAAVKCDGNFPAGDKFVLYVTGFGRFEGRVVLHESGVLRLAFTIGENKQNRLKHMLALSSPRVSPALRSRAGTSASPPSVRASSCAPTATT